MNGQLKISYGRILSVVVAAMILFSSLGEPEANAQNELSCNHQTASAVSDHHSKACEGLPSEHEHSPSDCSEACHLGHCHSAHGSFLSQHKGYAFLVYSPKNLSLVFDEEKIYLNPHLGKPFQPPKA